jgi:hypothetical protein
MTTLTCWTCSSLETQPVLRPSPTVDDGIDLTLITGVWTADGSVPTVDVRGECYVQGCWQACSGPPTVLELGQLSAELLGPPSIAHRTERVRRSPQGERGLEQRDDLGIPFFLG